MHVDKYELKDGLSNRQVNAVYKDSRGLLWVGTHYGLNSYDGYGFKFYTKERDGLPFNDINKILEDDTGNLMLMGITTAKDVASFNPVTHKVRLLSEEYPEFQLYSVKDAISTGNNVIYMNIAGVKHVAIYSAKKKLVKIDVSGFGDFSLLHRGAGNTLYAVANGNELLHLDSALRVIRKWKLDFNVKNHTYGQKSKSITLRVDGSFSTNNAYHLDFTDSLKLLTANDLPPRDETAIDVIFDTEVEGVVWRQGRLYDSNKKLVTDLAQRGYKDLAKTLRAVYFDKGKIMWVGNDFGLYKISISTSHFSNYFTDAIFKEDNTNSYRGIYIDGSKLYSSNEWKGLCIQDFATGNAKLCSANDEFGGFTCLLPDGKGNILQGGVSGLKKRKPNGDLISEARMGGKDVRVWCMEPIGNDIFLCGTEKGLCLYDNAKEMFLPFTQQNSFTDVNTAFIVSIVNEGNGIYWLCTDKGLYTYTKGNGIIRCYNLRQDKYKLPVNEVFSMVIDAGDLIWLGSNEGLVKWNRKDGTNKIYTRADGLSDNTIYTVQADANGNLWLGSNYGLMRFNKETEQVKTYLIEDGVSNNEFNRISSYKDAKGIMYFGTLNGLTTFTPADFIDDARGTKSPLIITSFKKFDSDADEMVDWTGSLLKDYTIVVGVTDKLFTLEYALLNYSYTSQNLYAYKIDDIQDEWVYTKERSLSFSRLPYGKYKMRIKAKALNGTWSDELVIRVDVLTPFYLQTWFFVFIALLILVLIFGYVSLRTYSYEREQARLEAEVRKKTATIMEQSEALKLSLYQKELLLKEIHHRVKNNLQVISGLLSLQGSSSGNAEVTIVMNEGRARIKSMALIHQMLYQNDDLQKLNFKEYLKQLLDNILAGAVNSGDVKLDVKADDIWFDIDTAIPLGLIVNEFATNSIKHAFINGKGSIEIKVSETEPNRFKLVYSDSGKGLPEGFDLNNAKTLGLKLVKMLSAQIKGQLSFRNDNGTIIELDFSSN